VDVSLIERQEGELLIDSVLPQVHELLDSTLRAPSLGGGA
jgi:hypothetical protein